MLRFQAKTSVSGGWYQALSLLQANVLDIVVAGADAAVDDADRVDDLRTKLLLLLLSDFD